MSDFRPGAPLYWSELEVVSRRVNLPPARVRALVLDAKVLPPGVPFDIDGSLVRAWRLDGEFGLDQSCSGESMSAKGVLVHRTRHLERSCPIELEIATWPGQCCELRVRPATRHVERWTGRKQRRYFALAHLCADDIVRRIGAAAGVKAPRRQSFVLRTPSLVVVGDRT